MCSLRCRRLLNHNQASRPRGRPCPCHPSADALGCKTPWGRRCLETRVPSHWVTGLAASLATSAPTSCSRPGGGMVGLSFRMGCQPPSYFFMDTATKVLLPLIPFQGASFAIFWDWNSARFFDTLIMIGVFFGWCHPDEIFHCLFSLVDYEERLRGIWLEFPIQIPLVSFILHWLLLTADKITDCCFG